MVLRFKRGTFLTLYERGRGGRIRTDDLLNPMLSSGIRLPDDEIISETTLESMRFKCRNF